ncbi:MAG: DNA polymerase III subunit gamma/tau [Nitrospinae bacterium]|nr:DNA polymerase III subunit gamma/tau [Nitrospinota bacterium]
MEFQVSARKWRPQKFSELIGQEPIVRTLTNAIRSGRISHSYLFSGTRGVGKTTAARIFAKALNCAGGPTPEPCDQCEFCVEIREGRNVDVLEIDGASNTGVADVRDIIENIRYATAACRYKVYIIDEVHMLSRSAFNALLKTLEEPPPKVVFLFATTEQHKIPETILSRCQRFEFKPLSQRQMVRQMEAICKHEGIQIDQASLEEIAKTGAGSMRDAQSLLDQVVAFSGREVTSGAVEAALGIVGQKVLERFVDGVAQRDAGALLEQVQEIVANGKDLHFFCRDLIEYFRNLLVVKACKKPELLINVYVCNLDALKRQAKSFHPDELHQMFRVLSRVETEMRFSSLPQAAFEMAVLRLTDVRPFRDIDGLLEKINRLENSGPASAPPDPTGSTRMASGAHRGQSEPGHSAPGRPPAREDIELKKNPSVAGETSAEGSAPGGIPGFPDWERIQREIYEKKPRFSVFLAQSRLLELNPNAACIELSDPYTLALIGKEENLAAIRAAIEAVCHFAPEVKLAVKSSTATALHDRQNANPPRSPFDKGGREDPPFNKGGLGGFPVSAPEANSEEKSVPGDYNKPASKSETEIIQDALDIFGGIVIR